MNILGKEGYLDVTKCIGGRWNYIVTLFGFEKYCRVYFPEYDKKIDLCAGLIANEEAKTNYDLRDSLDIPLMVANHIIQLLQHEEYIKVSSEKGERIFILGATVKLRRALR